MNKNKEDKIVLYTDKKGNVELRADVEKDTLWATQDQIARLFDTQRPAITKHLNNIFKTRELSKHSVCSILERTALDGKRYAVKHYNLDAIIAVGYRVNSKKATKFRVWATSILREYLVKGFNLNKRQLAKSEQNFDNLREAIEFMKSDSIGGPLKASVTVRLKKKLLD